MEEDELEMQQVPQDALAEAGRGTDTQLAHMSLGEIVIPRAFLDDPQVMAVLQQMFEAAGADMNQYTVGHEANKINPETGYPEFGFFKRLFNGLSKVGVTLNQGVKGFTDTALANAVVAGNYLLPGSSMVTSKLVPSGAQKRLDSGIYKIANVAAGASGGGFGSDITGIKSAADAGYGYANLADAAGLGDVYNSASGALNDIGGTISGKINDAYSGSYLQDAFKSGGDVLKTIGLNTSPDAVGQGIGATGGGGESVYSAADQNLLNNAQSVLSPSTAATAAKGATEVASQNYASPIASALLGSYTNNKAEEQLLAQQRANQSLLAPYQNFKFDPQDLQNDSGYQFNLAQGNQSLDRAQLARGGYFSGNALKEAQTFGQGLADNTYNTAFNRALQTNQEGLRGAGAMAGINDNIGNIRAGSTVNSGNLYSGALGSILGGDSFTNSGALQGGSGGDYLSNLLRQLELQQLTAA